MDKPLVPWWRIATAVLLSVALAITAAAGRVVEAIIIGVLLLPSLALLAAWLVARRRGRLAGER